MASQYAGWQIAVGKFFAMGSGPMRAAHGKEELYDHIPGREQAPVAVGCLETRKLPDDAVIDHLAATLNLPASKINLLVAPAASMAGNLQVVARSLETALHKLHELKFDLNQVVSGLGSAPLPPVAKDELGAIGRTNDAILYGGRVILWVQCEDDQIAEIGPKVPASASPDYGTTFASIFQRYQNDFYKIDPMLFSPAEIVFQNIKSGRSFAFGRTKTDVLYQSFYSDFYSGCKDKSEILISKSKQIRIIKKENQDGIMSSFQFDFLILENFIIVSDFDIRYSDLWLRLV